jgi:hypothetical protein
MCGTLAHGAPLTTGLLAGGHGSATADGHRAREWRATISGQGDEQLRRLQARTPAGKTAYQLYCVLSTYRGAQDCDLTPIILRGSLASGVPENIGFVERISDVISYGALKKVLG